MTAAPLLSTEALSVTDRDEVEELSGHLATMEESLHLQKLANEALRKREEDATTSRTLWRHLAETRKEELAQVRAEVERLTRRPAGEEAILAQYDVVVDLLRQENTEKATAQQERDEARRELVASEREREVLTKQVVRLHEERLAAMRRADSLRKAAERQRAGWLATRLLLTAGALTGLALAVYAGADIMGRGLTGASCTFLLLGSVTAVLLAHRVVDISTRPARLLAEVERAKQGKGVGR